MEGQKGKVSRLGSKKSGLHARLNGWNFGVRVVLEHNEKTGKDQFHVYETGGSNGARSEKQLMTVRED